MERQPPSDQQWRGNGDLDMDRGIRDINTPMATSTQPPPLLPRPPIQRQEEYTDRKQVGRTRLASNNKRRRSHDRYGNEEEEHQPRNRRY